MRKTIPVLFGAILSLYILIEEVRPRIFPKRFGEVVQDTIFRSGRIHPDIYDSVLKEHEIDTIISLTEKKSNHDWQDQEIEIAKELGVPIYRFPLKGDGTGNPSEYQKALVRLRQEENAGRNVLLHCAAGTNRTGGAIFLYRTIFEQTTDERAISEMLRYDFSVKDNGHLIPYLKNIRPSVERTLRSEGLL
ncbi:hypothetical protein CBE37_03300 [bacterium TMED277]|nr:MAG: hypothetical protein CBE37_03300 [bacterium TMED277]